MAAVGLCRVRFLMTDAIAVCSTLAGQATARVEEGEGSGECRLREQEHNRADGQHHKHNIAQMNSCGIEKVNQRAPSVR
jgi:hypothetical protein